MDQKHQTFFLKLSKFFFLLSLFILKSHNNPDKKPDQQAHTVSAYCISVYVEGKFHTVHDFADMTRRRWTSVSPHLHCLFPPLKLLSCLLQAS